VSNSINADELDDVIVEDVESAYHSMNLSEQKKFIGDALEQLSVENRLLLTLYYLNENSIDEVTEITGIPQENVKMKLHRARNKMYAILQTTLKSEIQSLL
jgi:RNA polymerase sigma-70 factor (ECF subfamily)